MAQPDKTQPVTVEVEYTYRTESHTQCWTFESLTPLEARDRILTSYVPLDATIWRYGIWHGQRDEKPNNENDTEFLSLDEIEATEKTKP